VAFHVDGTETSQGIRDGIPFLLVRIGTFESSALT
jgi:hypothetical protein